MKSKLLIFLSSILLLSLTPQAFAKRIFDSRFYNWTIYETQDGEFEEKKCFMIMNPVKSDSDYYSRKDPYFMITRYQNRRIEEISLYSGFEYKLNSKVLISIDNLKFDLVTNKDMAWARNKYEDASIIQIMLDSAYLKVRADSSTSSYAVDEYSLKGIARAYSRLKSICE